MKRKWLEMRYDQQLDCWFIVEGGQIGLLFGGERMELYMTEDRSIFCQLEYSNCWILTMGTLRLQMRTEEIYKIVM